jgi:hypothetical protein
VRERSVDLDIEDLELIVRRVHSKESQVVGRNGEWTHLQRIEGQEGALRDRARRGQQQTETRDGDEADAVRTGEFTNRSNSSAARGEGFARGAVAPARRSSQNAVHIVSEVGRS